MKKIVCEMCESTEFLKDDGMFVCQGCGMKYSLEEAKKMMIDDGEAPRTSADYRSEELKKLYQAARNARQTSDDDSAVRHYEYISAQDPNSWEALFYLVVLKTNSIKNGEIGNAAINVSNSLPKVFELINTYVEDETEKKAAVEEVLTQCSETANWLSLASNNFYKTLNQGNGALALTGLFGVATSLSSSSQALKEDQMRCIHAAQIMAFCGDLIQSTFGMREEFYRNHAVLAWKQLLGFHIKFRNFHNKYKQGLFNENYLSTYASKIRIYEPNYYFQDPNSKKSY